MINQLIRYIPVIEFIQKQQPRSICEAGSGSYGIGKFLDIEFTGVDSTFDDYQSSVVENQNPKMQRITASADAIPVPDNSFDMVFTLDMFEHMTPEQRSATLTEMMRIAKKHVIVGFPCGETARTCDVRMNRFYTFIKKTPPGWLQEHLAGIYPSEHFFDELLKANQYRYSVQKNENALFHLVLNMIEVVPIFCKWSARLSTKKSPLVHRILHYFSIGKCYRKIYILEK